MRLFKLSVRNIRKSVKDYTIYFFSLILGISVFYVFNAIEDQTVMLNISKSTYEVVKLMNQVLSAVSVFVSFILGFLIIYANRFLIKRRNKEFGVYLTLGMGKWKISMILFFETLIIGVISLAVGLLAGTGLSQLMSILVANMFEADMTRFSFIFSWNACVKTLIYFSVMYLLVMIFNIVIVGRCKLINLLNSGKRSEKIRLKNPVLSTVIFLASVSMLGYAYWMVTGGAPNMDDEDIGISIVLGAVGTFLLFWSLSGILLRIVSHMKGLYYRGLNSFILRQLSSKINTTVFSMTVICLMLFVTICTMSSALTMRNSMIKNLDTLAPVDIIIEKRLNIPEDDEYYSGFYSKEQITDSNFSVSQTLNSMDFDIQKYFKDVTEFNIYSCKAFTVEKSLGASYEKIQKEYPNLAYGTVEDIVKLSDYNRIAKLYGLEEITLEKNQYAVSANFEAWVNIRNVALSNGVKIQLNGSEYEPKYNKCLNGFIEIGSNYSNMGFFIVPDSAVNENMRKTGMLAANYNAHGTDERYAVEDEVLKLADHPYIKNTTFNVATKISLAEASVGLGTMAVFIGLYLGIVFLISGAAILALKELSESSDNRERYKMLRKIGADEKIINRALFIQIGIFFLFPLLVAVIHSVFGILFCNFILETVGVSSMLGSIMMTAVFLVLIYGGYFLITYFCSKSIIKERD